MKIGDIQKLMGGKVTRHQILQWRRALSARRNTLMPPERMGGRPGKASVAEYSEIDNDFEPLLRIRHAMLLGYGVAESVDLALLGSQLSQAEEGKYISVELVRKHFTTKYYSLLFNDPLKLAHPQLNPGGRENVEGFPPTVEGTGFDLVAGCISRMLNAERAGIYVPHHNESTLVLVGESSRIGHVSRVGFRIDTTDNESLTARAARTGNPINLFGNALNGHFRAATHLPSPRHSVLALPVIDRKNHLAAVIKVENKHPLENLQFGIFDHHDEALLGAFSALLLPVMELYRWFIRGASFLTPITEAVSLKAIAEQLLTTAVRITAASLGEITSASGGRLIMMATTPAENALQPGAVLAPDRPSISYGALVDRKTKCVPNVDQNENYWPCNAGTSSEIAVPIIAGNHIYGVMNIESSESGKAGLSELDVPILESLASLYATASETRALRDWLASSLTKAECERLIERLTSATNTSIDAWLVCRVNHGDAKLQEIFSRPFMDRAPFERVFSARSLVTKVYHDGAPYFSESPERDPNVWTDGLKLLGIKGSLVGLPIFLDGPVHDIVIGVLAAWSSGPPLEWTSREATSFFRKCEPLLRYRTSLTPLPI